MATQAAGRDDGRASALTVVLPLRWWGRAFLTGWFWLLRRRRMRRWAFGSVDELQFISAIRWSLLPALDVGATSRRRARRWHLLFESNFDGDWDEYLDTFGKVLARPLETIIRAGVGYPGLEIPGMFKAYTRVNDHVPEHYVAAHPTLTARDIRREHLARTGPDVVRCIAAEGYGRSSPRWTTFLLPLRPGRDGAAARAARTFDAGDGQPTVFEAAGRVHFARIVILRQAARSWLLVTMTHDGPVEPIVHEVIAAEARRSTDDGPSRVRTLLDCVDGVPAPSEGWWDDGDLARFLLDHRPASARRHVAYCPYPGSTVADLLDVVLHPRRDDDWPTGGALSGDSSGAPTAEERV